MDNATNETAAAANRLPHNASGSINWRSMTSDQIAEAHAAAVAVGDRLTARKADAALFRSCLRAVKAARAN